MSEGNLFTPDDICKGDYVVVRMRVQFDCTCRIVFVQDDVGEQIGVNIEDVIDVQQAIRVGDSVRRRAGSRTQVGRVCGVDGDLAWVRWDEEEACMHHQIRPIGELWRHVEQAEAAA